MTTAEIISLINAGYTKAEIEAMDAKPEQMQPEEGQPEEGQPEEKNAPGSWADVEKMIADMIKPMQENLDKTLKAIQAANVKGAVGGKTESVTVESVVADFFGKPQKGGK